MCRTDMRGCREDFDSALFFSRARCRRNWEYCIAYIDMSVAPSVEEIHVETGQWTVDLLCRQCFRQVLRTRHRYAALGFSNTKIWTRKFSFCLEHPDANLTVPQTEGDNEPEVSPPRTMTLRVRVLDFILAHGEAQTPHVPTLSVFF